eukprot:NODE_12223_length_1238_cov_2.344734.p1 GENE.NODE_12223_length_1238_cov_2.344734~~NODE_12223_length_1238_cov_2.344734.p1  ORF type:complete len:244 (-),score=59.02 NODE_12223_length_1238_cov_2.344734:282-1013(-)
MCCIGRQYMVVVQPLFGAMVRVVGREHLDASRTPLVVPNHISDFDACMIWAANPPGEQMLVVNDHWQPVIKVVQSLGWPITPIYTTGDRSDVKETLRVAIQDSQSSAHMKRVLLFAEGKTSSGLMVMRFSAFAFTLGAPVVPIAMKIWNPWPLQMQCNGCSILRNLATLFFLPWVSYEVTILPEECNLEGLDGREFAEQVRARICKSLGVPPSELCAKDKEAFARQRKEIVTYALLGREADDA